MSEHIHSRGRAFRSGSWATLQQFITLGSTALSGIILARVLSITDFGIFSYATTLASMGSAVITAGLSALAIRVLVDSPTTQRTTMTALIVIRELFAAIAYAVLLAVSFSSGSPRTIELTAIAMLVLFARGFDATELWFQSRAESHKSASVRISVVLVLLAVRILLAIVHADLLFFVILYVVEAVLTSALLLVRYWFAAESPRLGRVELHTPARLFKTSWLLAASSIAAQVNSRADVVVIQAMLGSVSVGLYSAAARMSEMLYFLPAVFMTATFPRLLQIRKKYGASSPAYQRELQAGYDQACWVGIIITVALVLFGPSVLELLYGDRYAEAGAVLRIHALALPFVFMGAVFSKWIVAENLLVASLWRHAFGAVLNIALNFALIPSLGIMGSAWATVASYFASSFLSCFATRSTRRAGVQMCLALIAPGRLAFRLLQRSR